MVTNLWLLRLIVGVAAELDNMYGRSTWNLEKSHDGFVGPLDGQSQLASLTHPCCG